MSITQKAISAMLWDFVGKGGLAFARFAESILLVRLLGNSDYGILTELLNYQAILVLLASFGVEGILSRFIPELKVKNKHNEIVALIRQATVIRASVLLILGGLCYAFAPLLIHSFSKSLSVISPEQIFYIELIAFLVISMGLQDLIRRILVVYYQQRLINSVEFIVFCGYLGVVLAILQQGGGITEVLLANIASKFLILLIFIFRSLPYYQSSKNIKPLPTEIKKRVFSYGTSFYFYSLTLYVLGKGSDILILGAFAGAVQVTFYRIAYDFSFFTISFFELALMGGFVLPFITEVYQKGDMENVRKVYTGLFEFLYLFIIPISVGGSLLSKDIIELFYGNDKIEAVPLLILFYIHFCIAKIGVLNSSFMLVSEQENRLIISRLVFGIFNVVLNLLLVSSYQALGVVLGTLITGVLASIYETWCVHQIVHPKYSLTFLWKILVASFSMGGIIWALSSILEIALWLKITILIFMGGSCYLGLLIGLKPISLANLHVLQQSKLPLKKQLFQLFSPKNREIT